MIRFFFIGLLISFSSWANLHPDYKPIYDLNKDWLIYDQDKGAYLPYFESEIKGPYVFSLDLELGNFPRASLLIKTPKQHTDIFIDNVLDKSKDNDEWGIYNLDDLIKKYGNRSVILSFLSEKQPSEFSAYIGYPVKDKSFVTDVKSKKSDRVKILPRTGLRYSSGLALAFVTLLVVTSFVANSYNRVYKKFFSLREILTLNVRDDLFLIGRPTDAPGVSILILTSVLVSMGIMIFDVSGLDLLADNYFYRKGDSIRIFITNFLMVTATVFVFLFLKYLVLILISNFFNIRNIVDAHFLKLIQSNLLFTIITILVLLVMYNTHLSIIENAEEYFIGALIVFFVFRLILIYFTINKDSRIKFSYIFSYLCIVEVLPFALGMNFIF